MSAQLCHFEVMCNDVARAKAFYGKVLGWKFDDQSMPDYVLVDAGAPPMGGMLQRPPQVAQAAMNVYFKVDSIEETMKLVLVAGGSIAVPRTPIPNVGAYAFFKDPEGVYVGLFQA